MTTQKPEKKSSEDQKPEIKKSSKKNYFNQDTEDSIVKFQQEQDVEKKKEIFTKEIRPAFAKLIENVIFVYKFYTMR